MGTELLFGAETQTAPSRTNAESTMPSTITVSINVAREHEGMPRQNARRFTFSAESLSLVAVRKGNGDETEDYDGAELARAKSKARRELED
ncbi:MAG: hypothetical protein ACK4N5_01345, partial [Myxococcales bacterium]